MIDRVLPLSQAPDRFAAMIDGELFGKSCSRSEFQRPAGRPARQDVRSASDRATNPSAYPKVFALPADRANGSPRAIAGLPLATAPGAQ